MREHDAAIRALLIDVHRTKIEDLKHVAHVKLVGTIRGRNDLVSPRSKRKCIAFDVWHPDGRHQAQASDFVLASGSAEIIVEAKDAALLMLRTRYQIDEARDLSISEGVLRNGNAIAAYGSVRFEVIPGARSGYRGMAERRPVLVATHLARDGGLF